MDQMEPVECYMDWCHLSACADETCSNPPSPCSQTCENEVCVDACTSPSSCLEPCHQQCEDCEHETESFYPDGEDLAATLASIPQSFHHESLSQVSFPGGSSIAQATLHRDPFAHPSLAQQAFPPYSLPQNPFAQFSFPRESYQTVRNAPPLHPYHHLPAGPSPDAVPATNNWPSELKHMCLWQEPEAREVCGECFATPKELMEHLHEDHAPAGRNGKNGKPTPGLGKDKKEFWCRWKGCERTQPFTVNAKLRRHLTPHSQHKPYLCGECGMACSSAQAHEQHMRIHTGETPWKCEYCGKEFKQQSALTMHVRGHTGEKPLKCKECGKTFAESSNLAKHRRTHREGRFLCRDRACKVKYVRVDHLRRHISSIHGPLTEEQLDDWLLNSMNELEADPVDSRGGSLSVPPENITTPDIAYYDGFTEDMDVDTAQMNQSQDLPPMYGM